jgi:hypothetical protein
MAKQVGKKRDSKIMQLNPNAAGIDIGSRRHYVAVPADRGQLYYEKQYRQRVLKNLTRRAREMGYDIICTNTGELVS